MHDAEMIEAQWRLLSAHRQYLASCLLKQATLGSLGSPPHITVEIDRARADIRRIKAILRAADENVEDNPDDEPPVIQPATQTITPASHSSKITLDLPMLLVLLTAIGVPAISIIVFVLTRRLDIALGWGSIYATTVVLARILPGALRHLHNLSYRDRYLQHLIYLHRSFDIKGLTTQGPYSLQLEQVFVELSLVPQPLPQLSSDPIGVVPTTLRTGRHSIWEYFTAPEMQSQHLAIIGPPGSGKTTLLKHITLTLTARSSRRLYYRASQTMPILLFLRDHTSAILSDPDLSLVKAIRSRFAQFGEQAASLGWIERQLATGHCLVMLDGLDEVAEPQSRQRVVTWVERQIGLHGNNRFIVTSRPFGYRSNPLAGVTVLEIRSFSMEQVRQFVQSWYLANENMSTRGDDPGVRLEAQQGAGDLLDRLQNTPTLADLAVNPLLLTMIANVHRYRSRLPGRRVELYSEIFEVFLGKRQQARGQNIDLTPAQKQFVLQELAYHMMCNLQREIELQAAIRVISEPLKKVSRGMPAEDFLRMVENSSGLLLERENNIYSFAHLTFQEYLAAVHIRDKNLEHDLARQVHISWWHETIRLYVAQADATPILAACLRDDRPSIAALTLAVQCSEEARQIDPSMYARLDELLIQGVEDNESERRHLIAEVFLALRLQRMVRVNEHRYIDTDLISHAEYQLFLDEQQPLGSFHQPDHWSGIAFPREHGRQPVVGLRPSDTVAFCHWLTQRREDGWYYRPLTPDEAKIDLPKVVVQPGLSSCLGYWTISDQTTVCINVSPIDTSRFWESVKQRLLHDILGLQVIALTNTAERRQILNLAGQRDQAESSFVTQDMLEQVHLLSQARDITGALMRLSDDDLQTFSTQDINLSSDLTDALWQIRERIRTLGWIRIAALNLEQVAARTLHLNSARIQAEALAQESADASMHMLDIQRASSNIRDLILALEHYSKNLNAMILRTHDLKKALIQASALACVCTSSLAHADMRLPTIIRTYLYRSNFALNLDLLKSSATTLNPIHNIEQASLNGQDLALAHACASVLTHTHNSNGSPLFTFTSVLEDLDSRQAILETHSDIERWFARICALILVSKLSTSLQQGENTQQLGTKILPQEMETLLDAYCHLYCNLVLLEERIMGNLTAFESIRVIREFRH